MKKLLLLTILLAVILPISSATKRALLIGISEYPSYNEAKDASWSNIHGANDVSLLKTTLKNKGFIISTLTNSQATASRIRKAFSKLQGEAKPGDIIYLHFSGHGQPFEDLNGDEEDGWDESIIPYDAQKVYKKGKYTGQNHITDDELNGYLRTIRKKVGSNGFVYVVIDACHAGSSYRGEEDEDSVIIRGTDKGFSMTNKQYTPRIDKRGKIKVEKSPSLSNICIIEACRSYQVNSEIRINGKYYGPLSYYVNQVLQTTKLDKNISWTNRVINLMNQDTRLVRQHPVIETSL